MRLIPHFKLRYKLLLILLACAVVPLVSMALVLPPYIQNQTEEALANTLIEETSMQEQLILELLTSKQEWTRQLAANPQIVNSLLLSDLQTTNIQLYSNMSQIIYQQPFIETVSVTDTNGQVIASTNLAYEAKPYPVAIAYTQPLNNYQTQILKTINNSHNYLVIPIVSPIRHPETGQALAVLIVEFNAAMINDLFSKSIIASSTEQIRNDSRSILLDHHAQPLTTPSMAIKQDFTQILTVQKCLQQSISSYGQWTNYAGQSVYGVSRCITAHDLSWILLHEQPITEAFQISTHLQYIVFSTALLLGLILTIISLFLSKQFTSPIVTLKQGVQKLKDGFLDYRIDLQSKDELQDLANDFNQMATKLQDQIIRLDQSAKLLINRDLDLRQASSQVEQEKQRMEAERNRLEVILAGISDAVIAVDHNYHISLINPAAEALIGYPFYQVIGKQIDKVITISDPDKELAATDYCPPASNSNELEVFSQQGLKLIGAKRRILYVNLTTSAINNNQIGDIGYIITLQNITSQQDLERMKLDFVSMAAHELRTPLTTVQGYLSFLLGSESYAKLQPQEQEFLTKATQSATRLNKLIENLLAVSRIEQGRLNLQLGEVQIDDIAKRLVEEMSSIAKEKNLELTYAPPPQKLFPVMGDPLRLEEVITNLIGNAIKYTNQGNIHVSVSQQDANIVCSIKDSGPGIPTDSLPHLFSKFFRIHSQLNSGAKGTGLGLYISKNIIEAHHGKIWVESQPGQGATFSFSLPIASVSKNS